MIICPECQKEYRHLSDLNIHYVEKHNENLFPYNFNGLKLRIKCDKCGETDLRRSSLIKNRHYHFCSRNCQKTDSSEKHAHGTDYGQNWERVRKETIQRDGEECQFCGRNKSKVNGLEVHHKTPITEFDDSDKANKPYNLVTVCRRCHSKLDQYQRILKYKEKQ